MRVLLFLLLTAPAAACPVCMTDVALQVIPFLPAWGVLALLWLAATTVVRVRSREWRPAGALLRWLGVAFTLFFGGPPVALGLVLLGWLSSWGKTPRLDGVMATGLVLSAVWGAFQPGGDWGRLERAIGGPPTRDLVVSLARESGPEGLRRLVLHPNPAVRRVAVDALPPEQVLPLLQEAAAGGDAELAPWARECLAHLPPSR